MRAFRLFCLWVLLALLPGCALWQDGGPPAEGPESPLSLRSWRMEGRIGVQARETAWQASLNWEHDALQDRLRISGPFSQGMVSIVLQAGLIYLNEGNGKTVLSQDADTLLRQRLGFVIPLSSLRYWMVGVPDPALSSSTVGAGFQQAGWRVAPEKLSRTANWDLPQKLRVEGAGVRLKILADEWRVNED